MIKLEGKIEMDMSEFWTWVFTRKEFEEAFDVKVNDNENCLDLFGKSGIKLGEIDFVDFWSFMDHQNPSSNLEMRYGVPRFDKESETLSISVAMGTQDPFEWDHKPKISYEWESLRNEAAHDDGYFRAVISYEVLSAGSPFSGGVANLAESIIDGDCSGKEISNEFSRVKPATMKKLLEAQGSDPDFLISEEDLESLEGTELKARIKI